MSERLKKYLILLLKVVFSGVALFLVVRNAEVKKAISLLASQNLTLAISAFLLYLFSKYITAERYRLLLNQIGITLTFLENGKLYLLGMYYNLFLPGGVSGDAYKAYYLNKIFKKEYKSLIKLTFLDRLGGVVAILALLLLLGVFLVPFKYSMIFIFSIPVLGVIYYFIIKKYFSDYVKIFVTANIQSIIGQIIQVGVILLLLMSIGINDHLVEYSFIFLISSIVSAFPLTIGGIGAREITFIYGATYFPLDASGSVVVGIIFYLITVLSSLLGLPYSFKEIGIVSKAK